MKTFHHIGIPTSEKKVGERYIPHLKMYVSGYEESPYRVEWIRFESDCPLPELVQTIPHVAFEVDNLERALEGKRVLIESNSPSEGITVAFIEDNGAPVEFLEMEKDAAMNTQKITTGTQWERTVGYSRAIRAGNQIEISGTVAVDDSNQVVGKGDPGAQAEYVLNRIDRILQDLGASRSDVIRTRMYVTDIKDWKAIGKVHGKYFKEVQPTTSMVEVSALIGPEYLVEIEVSAVVQD